MQPAIFSLPRRRLQHKQAQALSRRIIYLLPEQREGAFRSPVSIRFLASHPLLLWHPGAAQPAGSQPQTMRALCNSTPTQVHQTEISMPKEAKNLQQWQFYQSQNLDLILWFWFFFFSFTNIIQRLFYSQIFVF